MVCYAVAGFCDSEPSDYDVRWPETEADNVASIPCGDDGRVATRVCSSDNGAEWLEPDTSQCGMGQTKNKCICIVIFSLICPSRFLL